MKSHCINGERSKALYERGDMTATSRIHSILSYPEGTYIFCDASPFQPEDYPLPGQPGDTGELIVGSACFPVSCVSIFISESLTGLVVRSRDNAVVQQGLDNGYYKLHIGHFVIDDGISDIAFLNSSLGETCLLIVKCSKRQGGE
jgi:hypothetical protein